MTSNVFLSGWMPTGVVAQVQEALTSMGAVIHVEGNVMAVVFAKEEAKAKDDEADGADRTKDDRADGTNGTNNNDDSSGSETTFHASEEEDDAFPPALDSSEDEEAFARLRVNTKPPPPRRSRHSRFTRNSRPSPPSPCTPSPEFLDSQDFAFN
ncbi:hypothetical protein SEMRO_3440_G348080.1 [Seminavis robusta]|uniref:Uncharacterized protein n=1 Tax=Seminavis robusta TaxID=568900 RepID=A0A9N8HZB2_9STRA|nr:hypothetical protein SEMRO_3440_G348080.1 [Seminavis robusta]|eukprot:Sro3440_g348080.1 n/a (154) ;mRNA; r:5758-6219